jgi:translation initiation factor 3 subunit G
MPRSTAALLEKEFPQPKKGKKEGETEIREIVEEKEIDGRRVRVTRRVRVQRSVVRTNRAVELRRAWKKFGEAARNTAEAEAALIEEADEVRIEVPAEKRTAVDAAEAAARTGLKAFATGTDIKCRICGEPHWTSTCPRRASIEGEVVDAVVAPTSAAAPAATVAAAAAAANAPSSDKYVPPNKRAGYVSTSGAGGPGARDDSCTVRVSNLSEEAQENDVRELFKRFGHITRVYIAKDFSTEYVRGRGFAFVTMSTREEAASAIEALNGFGYDHLILSVNWSKPSTK